MCPVFSDGSSLQSRSPFDFCSPSTPTQAQSQAPGQVLGQADPFQLPKENNSPFSDPTSLTIFNTNTGPDFCQLGFVETVLFFWCFVVYFLGGENYIVNSASFFFCIDVGLAKLDVPDSQQFQSMSMPETMAFDGTLGSHAHAPLSSPQEWVSGWWTKGLIMDTAPDKV